MPEKVWRVYSMWDDGSMVGGSYRHLTKESAMDAARTIQCQFNQRMSTLERVIVVYHYGDSVNVAHVFPIEPRQEEQEDAA